MFSALVRFLKELVAPNHDGPLRPSARDLVTLSLYAVCSAVYVLIGVWKVDFLLSLWVAMAYLLIAAWLVPAAVRRVL